MRLLLDVGRAGLNVQQRGAIRHPAAAGEPILLAVNRQMKSTLRGHDLGGHARVVAVALDQALRPRRLHHATLGVRSADELGIFGHPHPQLGTLELQRLRDVVADQLTRTMLGTLLLIRRHVRDHFVAFQMLGQLFVADFAGLFLPADEFFFADILRLLRRRIGQAVLDRFVAEVELLLGRIYVPLAAMTGQTRQQLLNRQVQLGHFLRERFARRLQVDEGGRLLSNQRATRGQFLP